MVEKLSENVLGPTDTLNLYILISGTISIKFSASIYVEIINFVACEEFNVCNNRFLYHSSNAFCD